MRITNKMMSNNFLRDMNVNMENLKKLQGQMSSGKEIQKPSDDPFKVARAMQLHTGINTNTQYAKNIDDTASWLDTTDTALDQVGNVLQRVRELLVSAGNAAYGPDEKTAIKNEINEKVGELSQVLNTNFDGRYVFGGTSVTTKPVMETLTAGNTGLAYAPKDITMPPASAAEIGMIKAKMSVEISQGVSMDYNVTAGEVLEFGAKDLKTTLSNITTHIDTDSVSNLTGQDLTDITDAITNVLKLRAEVGAKSNRMESAKAKNEDETFNMTDMLSKTEDIDITQKTMEYATMQTIYQASLQTSAKVIQPTLLDYLK